MIEAKPGKTITGYAGKILRINLTDSTTEIISTYDYVPQLLGGRAVCNRIFWDEVKGNVKAFDPENKLILMTGPGCATGLPVSSRCTMTGVSPNALPEQYSHSNIGGAFGSMLKWAGYDGFILEGRADKPTYVLIDDDKISFLDASSLWGKLIIESQEALFDMHGDDVESLVIGPAGEHLCRNASIASGSDCAIAKTGFGAVFGSKNLKAITVHGTGEIAVSSYAKILSLRMNPCHTPRAVNPMIISHDYSWGGDGFKVPEGFKMGYVTNCLGCSERCCCIYYDTDDPLNPGEKVAQTSKCLDIMAANLTYDCGYPPFSVIHSHRQEKPGTYKWFGFNVTDPDDPLLPELGNVYEGDRYDLWGPNLEFGRAITWCCNQYGLDKWDMICWYFTWLAMAKKEGLLDDIDFGREVDLDDPEFAKYYIHMIVYREGIGDDLAEGMARFIRKLGKEKYGDTIYHGRYSSNVKGYLDIPVSLESAWGHCSHWQGRGFQGDPKYVWLAYTLSYMLDTRDAIGSQHYHVWYEDWLKFKDDPAHSDDFVDVAIENCRQGDMKDSVVTCDWRTPNPLWPDMEAELFSAATGIAGVTEDDLMETAEESRLLYRAILMRNYDRDRDLEVKDVYPFITYPDPWGETCTWDELNDFVDLYYRKVGWDPATGWPTRSTWERYGLKDIADEMEALGKLPPEGRTEYERTPNPIGR